MQDDKPDRLFDIEELQLLFNANIKSNQQEIIFKRSMMQYPDLLIPPLNLNELPYFTYSVKYPEGKIYKMTLAERLEFFFNKQNFELIINNWIDADNSIFISNDSNDHDEDEFFKKRDDNIDNNIKLMLFALFPTDYPEVNNVKTSYDLIANKSTFSVMSLLSNALKSTYSSYFNPGDNKTYTFKEIIWLNDVFNQPKYRKLIIDCHNFNVSVNVEKQKQLKLANNEEKRITELTTKIVTDFVKVVNQMIARSKTKDETFKFVSNVRTDFLNPFIQLLVLLIPDEYQIDEILNIEGLYDQDIQSIGGLIDFELKKQNNEDINIDQNISNFKKIIKQIDDLTTTTALSFPNIILLNVGKGSSLKPPINEIERNQLNEIQKLITQIQQNPLKNIIGKYEKLINLTTKTRKENETYSSEFPEYRNFEYNIMREYRSPARETTNIYLQELINGQNESNVIEFHDVFGQLYKSMRNQKPLNDEIQKYSKLGIDNTNIIDNNNMQRVIYLLVDFFDGKLTPEIKGKMFCPYTGEKLGTDFELIKSGQLGKFKRRLLEKPRDIFSLDKLITIRSNQSNQSNPVNRSNPVNPVNRSNPVNPVNQRVNIDHLKNAKTLFLNNIYEPNKKQITTILNNYTKMVVNVPLTEHNLLDYLINNDKTNNMKKILLDWAKNQTTQNRELDDLMNQTVAKYAAANKIITKDINQLKTEGKTETPKNIQLKNEFEKNNLYMSIINLFIEAEDKKQPNAIPYRGGKRRGYHYNKTKKNKVTNRTILNKTKRHFSRG